GLESVWLLVGLLIGTYANWKFIAARLRKYTELANNSITLPDYFENRFSTNNKTIRIVSAIFILIFFLIYTSSGFVAGAKLFSSVFDISYIQALLIGGFVIVSYTFLGGFLAVSWTDVIQGSIMFFAIIFVPIYAIIANGGFQFTLTEIIVLNSNHLSIFTNNEGELISLITVFSLLGWGLGYFGQPHILARFMAIKDVDHIKKARKIAMNWVTFSLISAMLLGMIGYAIFPDFLQGTDSEKIFILMVEQLVHPLLAGILLAAILAAIMSTADSQLLVASSSLTEDIYKYIFRKSASDLELVWISRFFVIFIAIVAILIGLDQNSSVLDLVAYAWAGFGATFGPIIILSLYWKGISEKGAIAGMIIGGMPIIIWKNLSGGIFDLYEIIPGFLFATLAILLFREKNNKKMSQIENDFKIISKY
ncbi:MAG: sodium/proline symporter PutP, partial [Ignavibacteriae bacterium]|nr:sodium/proline symporter PutP [Ignavibacteriota bacterium]